MFGHPNASFFWFESLNTAWNMPDHVYYNTLAVVAAASSLSALGMVDPYGSLFSGPLFVG